MQITADNAVNGLILFSFGTNMHSQELGETVIENILEAFEIFPEFTFLWNIDMGYDIDRIPNNVVISKWFPQNSVLGES